MRFAEIGRSREWSGGNQDQWAQQVLVLPEQVEGEARRRKVTLRLDEWQMREFVTNKPIPDRVRHLVEQIDLAASALMRMSPIPSDYRDDVYWPRVW